MEWVPFKQHPKGPAYIPAFSNTTEEPLDPPDEGSIYYDKNKIVSSKIAYKRLSDLSKKSINDSIKISYSPKRTDLNRIKKKSKSSPSIFIIIIIVIIIMMPFFLRRIQVSKYLAKRLDFHQSSSNRFNNLYSVTKTV